MKRALTLLLGLSVAACAGNPLDTGEGANLKEAARINTQLGVDYLRKGEMNLSEEKLKRAISEDPKLALAHSALGILYSRRGRDDDAEQEFKEAVSLEPGNADSLNNYGSFLCAKGKTEDAEEMFLKAAKNKNNALPADAWANAGVCLRNTPKARDRAPGYLREALKLNPKHPDALAEMAQVCYDKKDYLRARAFLQRYEVVARQTPQTLLLASQNERALGDMAAARDYERRLRKEFPESAEADGLNKPAGKR